MRVVMLMGLLVVKGCACDDAFGEPMSVCASSDDETLQLDFVPTVIAGTVVDDVELPPMSGTFCRGVERHTLTLDTGDAVLARFDWGQSDVDLDVSLEPGVVTASVMGGAFDGSSSLLLEDARGVVAAFNGLNPALSPSVPGLRVTHGDWAGSELTGCGRMSAHAIAVTVDDTTTQVHAGESVPLELDGDRFTFFAFASSKLDPPWTCTDGVDPLSWALVRER